MSADTIITGVHAREVLDSRGNPTVEVDLELAGGAFGRAIVPSGASTGRHEALELRDADPSRYDGRGVLRAVNNVNHLIAPRVCQSRMDGSNQPALDEFLCNLDGTPNKSKLGANAILGVSVAAAHASAVAMGVPLYRYLGGEEAVDLPVPMINIISGGQHSGLSLDFQDFLVIPVGAGSYRQALEQCGSVYRAMYELLGQRGLLPGGVADEGGFGPRLESNEAALGLLVDAITLAGLQPGRDGDMAIGLDVAATEFYEDGKYRLHTEGLELTAADMVGLLQRWCQQYPIISIEDALSEDDWDGWESLTGELGRKVQLIGDDLFTTNPLRLQQGIDQGAANAVLVKLNQIGTLSETLDVVKLAQRTGYLPVISARSGETEDSTIADLAVATGAGQIKIGSLARSERLAKYNQLLRIEDQLGDRAKYRGREVFARFLS